MTLGLGLGILASSLRPARWSGRAISAALALLWVFVAWTFFWNRYAAINWAATYFGWLFIVQAVLLGWLGVARDRLTVITRGKGAGLVAAALLVASVALYPLIAAVSDRGWGQAEVFGIAPDPTAVATLALALRARRPHRWALLPAPALWCLISGATLWAMGSPEAWVAPGAALTALVVSARAA